MPDWGSNRANAIRLGSIVAILVIWQVLIGVFSVVPAFLLPPPTAILAALGQLLNQASFINDVEVTFVRVVAAAILASVPGVILGLAMGWSRTVKALVFPIVTATYPLPKVALLPLFMLVFGIGDRAFVITTAIAATFLVMFNSMRGVSDIGTLYFEVAQDNDVDSAYTYFREILLPGALPMIFTGLRLTLNTALLVTISIEFVAARHGIGAFIWSNWNTLQTAQMYAAVFVVSLAGVAITYGLEWAAEYSMPWRSEMATAAVQ